jgi:hypothetical protein
MAQHDYSLANAAGATYRSDNNNALAAIVSLNSGATAPATPFADMLWYDTTADALKQRNGANTAWFTLITFDQSNSLLRWDFDEGADIASAATTDIGAATGNSVTITGTTTITGLGTIKAGVWRLVTFAGALTLTHNATSLILPGGANITTAAGDTMLAVSLGSGNWRVAFFPADGTPVVSSATGGLIGLQVFTANGTWTPTAGTVAVEVDVKGAGGGAGEGSSSAGGGGGGGGGEGGRAIKRITSGLGATETITVGTGGSGGTGNGSAGGTSSFGSHCSATSGGGGFAGGSGVGGIGGAAGIGSSGDLNIRGTPGANGGTGDGSSNDGLGGPGGGEGGGGGGAGAGAAGVNGGGGAGGAASAGDGDNGGAGGAGYVIVREYS